MKKFSLFLLKSQIQAGCPNDLTDNLDYQSCSETVLEALYKCASECPDDDRSCQAQCERVYGQELNKCPCMDGCPEGCPCPEYSCTSSLLIINNYNYPPHIPYVITTDGQYRETSLIYDDETESNASCSVIWKNRFFLFGGYNYKDQITEVTECRLKRIGSLPYEFEYGGCGLDPKGNIYLCFGEVDTKMCQKSSSPTSSFNRVIDSNHHHRNVRVASSKDEMFTVGSFSPNSAVAELYHFESAQWKVTTSYPFGSYISHAPIVNQADVGFIIFGGLNGSGTNVIARFNRETEQWTKLGTLNSARHGSGAIQTSDQFLVVGGWNQEYLQNEICSFSAANVIQCEKIPPSLFKYAFYPEIFPVPDDYCKLN